MLNSLPIGCAPRNIASITQSRTTSSPYGLSGLPALSFEPGPRSVRNPSGVLAKLFTVARISPLKWVRMAAIDSASVSVRSNSVMSRSLVALQFANAVSIACRLVCRVVSSLLIQSSP